MSKTKETIEQLNNDDWEEHNPSSFNNSLRQSKHPKMLTPYSDEELGDMKLFKLKGKKIGFALKKSDSGKHDEIVAVHNNEEGVSGIGDHLLRAVIRNGGVRGDHFDGHLTNLYRRNGFVTVRIDKYNPEYDKDGEFAKRYGKKDVHYVVHKSALPEKQSSDKTFLEDIAEILNDIFGD